MQVNRYLDNPYSFILESSVLEARIIKKKTAMALKENIFYPGGGGQPIDLGNILINNEVVTVRDVKKMDKKVFILLDKKIEVLEGDKIIQKIDSERRLCFMKFHSAAHMLMASVKRNIERYNPEKIEISDDCLECTIFFEGIWDGNKDSLSKIVNDANTAINQNLNIFSKDYDDANIPSLEYGDMFRVAGSPTGPVRVLVIESWDANPCGGTHVSISSEIGNIKPISHSTSSITFTLF
jgi:Ser-tRNA(Ala) deacylase AlaX